MNSSTSQKVDASGSGERKTKAKFIILEGYTYIFHRMLGKAETWICSHENCNVYFKVMDDIVYPCTVQHNHPRQGLYQSIVAHSSLLKTEGAARQAVQLPAKKIDVGPKKRALPSQEKCDLTDSSSNVLGMSRKSVKKIKLPTTSLLRIMGQSPQNAVGISPAPGSALAANRSGTAPPPKSDQESAALWRATIKTCFCENADHDSLKCGTTAVRSGTASPSICKPPSSPECHKLPTLESVPTPPVNHQRLQLEMDPSPYSWSNWSSYLLQFIKPEYQSMIMLDSSEDVHVVSSQPDLPTFSITKHLPHFDMDPSTWSDWVKRFIRIEYQPLLLFLLDLGKDVTQTSANSSTSQVPMKNPIPSNDSQPSASSVAQSSQPSTSGSYPQPASGLGFGQFVSLLDRSNTSWDGIKKDEQPTMKALVGQILQTAVAKPPDMGSVSGQAASSAFPASPNEYSSEFRDDSFRSGGVSAIFKSKTPPKMNPKLPDIGDSSTPIQPELNPSSWITKNENCPSNYLSEQVAQTTANLSSPQIAGANPIPSNNCQQSEDPQPSIKQPTSSATDDNSYNLCMLNKYAVYKDYENIMMNLNSDSFGLAVTVMLSRTNTESAEAVRFLIAILLYGAVQESEEWNSQSNELLSSILPIMDFP